MSAVIADVALVESVRERLARSSGAVTPHRVAEILREGGSPVGDATVLAVFEALRLDVTGAGPLEPLLREPGVTDVLVNGADSVYVDRGRGLVRADVRLAGEDGVRRLAQRLAASVGRRLDDATPYVDARLRDGTRLHAVLAPVARPGTTISLRIPPTRAFSLADLVACGTVPTSLEETLRGLVRSRAAFLISGGTGTGKTTILSSLLSTVDAAERVIVVEDSAELRPHHPHVVSLEARPPNIEGAGSIDLRTLVKQALRMRPDRLVVGEVRGAEVVDLLAALNTGHEGGCGTIHANSASDVPARLEALGLAAGLDRAAVHSQIAAGLDAVIHLRRDRAGLRHLDEIAVPLRDARGLVTTSTAVRCTADGTTREGPGMDRLQHLLGGSSR